MNRPITLGDFIALDEHLKAFHSSHDYRVGIQHVECMIMNTYGTQISYHECLEGAAPLFTVDQVHAFVSSPLKMSHPDFSNVHFLQYNDQAKHESIFCAMVLNPIMGDEVVVGAWFVKFDYNTALLHRERYLDDFNFHYLEQMIHHLQMVIINYEKLYYIIDIYTELLMHKDRFMPYHMTNVANWCMLMAGELNLPYREQMVIYIAALIHDIGKLFVPDEFINRPGGLSEEEFRLMKQHPEKGYQMAIASLYGMTFFQEVPTVIRSHHERYDGRGYPQGLKGSEIPYLSRILTLADTTDAMMSRRAYKDKVGVDEIIREISRQAGRQFDPVLAEYMVKLLVEQSAAHQEATIANTHFVPQASLNFYYRDIKHQLTITGNLVVKEGKAKMIVHNGYQHLETVETEHVHRCTLSYYQMTDFVEFTVDFEGHIKDQVFLGNLKPIPTDKYFSIIWDGAFTVESPSLTKSEVRFVKLGGDSIVFEAKEQLASELEQYRGEVFSANIDLQVEETIAHVDLDFKIVKYYSFSNQTTFIGKYLNISTGDRDRILRMLFKKQMLLKQLKKEAATGGNHV